MSFSDRGRVCRDWQPSTRPGPSILVGGFQRSRGPERTSPADASQSTVLRTGRSGCCACTGLKESESSDPLPSLTIDTAVQVENIVPAPSSPPFTDVPLDLTETPQSIETQTIVIESTPRPTNTSTSQPGKPFALTGQETICDANLPNGLLQVMVLNSNRRQIAGVEIEITWEGGEEQFFTGLKPELGNGYADYIMTPDITYSIQLTRG